MLAGIAWAETPAINKAKTQAEALREQIDELDAQVEAAVEEYNTADSHCWKRPRRPPRRTSSGWPRSKSDLASVTERLSDRLVDIYKEGHLGVINTLVGSESFSDLINRLSLLERLSKQDSDLVAQVSGYRDEVTQRKADLEQQIADQERYKSEAAVAENKVETQLAAKEKALKGKEKLICPAGEGRGRAAGGAGRGGQEGG